MVVDLSRYSQSGLGDHGPEGIRDFIKNHKCTHICSSMNLCTMSTLQDTLDEILEE
jgi:hypothetical protein